MFSWVFKWWRVRQLKKQTSIAHKMKLNTQRLKAECVLEIKETYKNLIQFFESVSRKIDIKNKKLGMIDETFTQKEIEHLKSKNRFFWFIVILFVLAETGLYYLTAQVFVPIENETMKIILALFLGLVVMIILNWAVSKHFEYRNKISQKEKLNLTDGDIKNARDVKIVGYFLILVCLFIILAAALVRIFYLEQMDLSGYNEIEIENLKKVGAWASYLTLGVTFALGIFLSFLKGEQIENTVRFKEWKKWRGTLIKLNKVMQNKIKTEEEIKNLYKSTIEKYWQLVKELERIWKIEFDEQDKDSFMQYKALKKAGSFKVDENLYIRFDDLLYADYELFKFGCEKDSNVNELISQATNRYVTVAQGDKK